MAPDTKNRLMLKKGYIYIVGEESKGLSGCLMAFFKMQHCQANCQFLIGKGSVEHDTYPFFIDPPSGLGTNSYSALG